MNWWKYFFLFFYTYCIFVRWWNNFFFSLHLYMRDSCCCCLDAVMHSYTAIVHRFIYEVVQVEKKKKTVYIERKILREKFLKLSLWWIVTNSWENSFTRCAHLRRYFWKTMLQGSWLMPFVQHKENSNKNWRWNLWKTTFTRNIFAL